MLFYTWHYYKTYIVWFQKIHVSIPRQSSSHGRFYFFGGAPPHLTRISSLASYTAFLSPSPSKFPMTFLEVGMDIFWNFTLKSIHTGNRYIMNAEFQALRKWDFPKFYYTCMQTSQIYMYCTHTYHISLSPKKKNNNVNKK